jgi:hypothetical protein
MFKLAGLTKDPVDPTIIGQLSLRVVICEASMGKAKIGFEIEPEHLANAKAYVARHGGSLNKLVSALFASLGRDERDRAPSIDPSTRILLDVSAGKTSIIEAAHLLELPDAGFVFHRLSEKGLPLPRLAESDSQNQIVTATAALDDCLIEPIVPKKSARRKTKPA